MDTPKHTTNSAERISSPRHAMQLSASIIVPGLNGVIMYGEKNPPEGYRGKHRKAAHALEGAAGQLWMGCQTCLEQLTDGMVIDRPVQNRHRRDRYWATPQV